MTTDEQPGGTAPRVGYIGKRLGRFLINAELGRGGMATVYRAHDPQLGRDVAVKVMHGFFAGRPDIEARFKREANAVAAIKHPSILALYDFAPPAGEEPGYIVSELVEGPGLRQLVDASGGRLLPEAAVLIAIRVADALGAAHAAGIVHRDVKPDNVLLDRAGGGARVVLTDFGVAHVSGLDTMTATGAVLGSPAYMSPEQARSDHIGPSSDVFSLGVLLYQLCTGHLPFPGNDPFTIIAAILRGEYIGPTKIEARVGPDLERIIARCLAPDPAARFTDGNVVAAALRQWLAVAALGDEEAALRALLTDPGGFEKRLAPVIARIAVAAGETARKRRQIPRALAEVGRALAYAPDDPAARALLDRIGAHRRARWIRMTAAAIGATVVIATGVVVGLHRQDRLDQGTSSAHAGPSAGPTAAATKPAALPVPGGMNPAAIPQPTATEPAAKISAPAPTVGALAPTARALAQATPQSPETDLPKTAVPSVSTGLAPAPVRARRASPLGPSHAGSDTGAPAVHRRAETKTSPSLPASRSGGDVTPPDQPPVAPRDRAEPPPAPPSATAPASGLAAQTPVAAARARASVMLRASHGFCEPSLDGYPPSLRAHYTDLLPGPHEVFCTLPQGGAKIHVATYDLRPGTHPSLIVVPDSDGKPVLGRPE